MKMIRPLSLAPVIFVALGLSLSVVPGQVAPSIGKTPLDAIEFEKTELTMALEFLSAKLKESHPDRPEVNFVLVDPDGTLAGKTVSFKLRRVPWETALRYTCESVDAVFRVEPSAIVVGEREAVERLGLQRRKILRGPGSAANEARLKSFMVESVAFDSATLEEVAEYLRLLVQGRMADEGAQAKTAPLNLFIKENVTTPVGGRKINLSLRKIPLSELIHYATGQVDCRFRIDARAVVIGESEDLARPPGGPPRPSGAIFNQLASKRLDTIDIPAGSSVDEFLDLVRTLGGVNGIAMTQEAAASSRLALHGVSTLELIRYFNEVSGTAFRLDSSAYLIVDDPAVPVKPKPPETAIIANPGAAESRSNKALGFDDP